MGAFGEHREQGTLRAVFEGAGVLQMTSVSSTGHGRKVWVVQK